MSQGSSGQEPNSEPDDEITWVGEQRLMDGYCGRAPVKPPPQERRPVAVVRRMRAGQAKVVRIGPPRAASA